MKQKKKSLFHFIFTLFPFYFLFFTKIQIIQLNSFLYFLKRKIKMAGLALQGREGADRCGPGGEHAYATPTQTSLAIDEGRKLKKKSRVHMVVRGVAE